MARVPPQRGPAAAVPSGAWAKPAPVRRQHLWDQIGDLNSGGFLAHRNPKKSEDKPEIPCQPVRVPAKKLAHDIRRAARGRHSAEDSSH